jgi:hypothetical protein
MYAIRLAMALGCAIWVGCSGSGDHGNVDGGAQNDAGAMDGSVGSHRDGSLADSDGSSGGSLRDGQAMLPDGSPFMVDPQGHVLCGDHPCACSNGMDDDSDGLVDLHDPECVASWDDDESSLATGIPGDNRDDACQDCFFDGNSGSGNDGCYLPSSCFSDGTAGSGHGICSSCEQTSQCANFCQRYAPNGCDCFGCCEIFLPNGTHPTIAIGDATCQVDGNTLTGCRTCVQNPTCVNTCDHCELCPGKTELPADCVTSGNPDAGSGTGGADGGSTTPPEPACGGGAQKCGTGLPACASGESCEYGCCAALPPVLF